MVKQAIGPRLLAPEVRALAARSGVNVVSDGTTIAEKGWLHPVGVIHKIFSKFKQYPRLIQEAEHGVTVDPSETLSLTKALEPGLFRDTKDQIHIFAKNLNWESDKLHEARQFKNFIPHSTIGENIRGTPDQKLDRISKMMGGQFLVKPRFGAAGNAKDFPNEHSSFEELSAALKDPNQMFQRREDMAQIPAWRQLLESGIAKIIPAVKNVTKGTREVRVHGLNGQVIPNSTMVRGNLFEHLVAPLLYRPARMDVAEKLVQQAMDKLPPNARRHGAFGFDVGFKPNMEPFLIEANPSDASGYGGWWHHPYVLDAIGAHIQGKRPLYMQARPYIAGTAALGAGGIGAAGYAVHRKHENARHPILHRLGLR